MSLSSQNTQSTTLNSQNIPRRQGKLPDGIRQRSIRSIIANDSSNSKIIYVYCSPKLKNALTFLLRFIIVAYCITVPLFVYLLHKESTANIDKLNKLERRFFGHLKKSLKVGDSLNHRKRRSYLTSGGNKSLQIGQLYFMKNYQTIPKLRSNVNKEIEKLNETITKYGDRMKKLTAVERWIYMLYNLKGRQNTTVESTRRNCSCSGEKRQTTTQASTTQGSNVGKTFIRWGSSTCKDSSNKMVYTGYMGGALPRPGPSSMKQGGGVNYLCLPTKPKYGNYVHGRSERRTYIDGVIYGESFKDLENKVITCSVCEAHGKTETVMIPGSHVCEKDWSVEYTGYIATDGKESQRSEYVCLDRSKNNTSVVRHMRIYIGSLDMVSVKCMEGILFCGTGSRQYRKNHVLPCVVCSR